MLNKLWRNSSKLYANWHLKIHAFSSLSGHLKVNQGKMKIFIFKITFVIYNGWLKISWLKKEIMVHGQSCQNTATDRTTRHYGFSFWTQFWKDLFLRDILTLRWLNGRTIRPFADITWSFLRDVFRSCDAEW